MACATAQDNETANWTTPFPNKVNSLSGSSLYMKKLLALSISQIVYLRAHLPQSAFGCKKLADIDVKILSDSSCPEASQVIDWMKACFEAFDYKYLRQLMVGIHTQPGDHDNVIEAYTFEFSYNADGTSVTCNGEEVCKSTYCDDQLTRKAAVSLLRMLSSLTEAFEPLPDDSYLTMKLLYYDVTPADYDPNGFVPAKTNNFFFNGDPVHLKVGSVSTLFHSVKVHAKADKGQFEIPDEEPMPSGSIAIQSSGRTDNLDNPCTDENMDNIDEEVTTEGYVRHNTGDLVSQSPDAASENGSSVKVTVCCPCGSREEEGLMILCMVCECWQHGVCFGVLEGSEVPESHICHLCYKLSSKNQNEQCDKDFYNLPALNMHAMCLWRRALLFVCEMKVVQPAVLAKHLQTDKSVAASIISRMEHEGYVTSGSEKNKRKKRVNRNMIIRDGIPKYLKCGTKATSEYNNSLSVDELNTEARNLHLSCTPKAATTSQPLEEMHDKKNKQPEGPKDSPPPVFSRLRGKKRANELCQDFGGHLNDKLECNNEARQKRKKASTCKSGILLPYATDK